MTNLFISILLAVFCVCVCVSLSLYSTKMANPILSVRHIDDDFNKKQQTRLYHTLCDFHIIED